MSPPPLDPPPPEPTPPEPGPAGARPPAGAPSGFTPPPIPVLPSPAPAPPPVLPVAGSRLAGPPQPAKSRRSLAGGFGVGVLAWLGTFLPGASLVMLLVDCFVLPVVAVILACIPATRRFGLGLLLAAALGWLVLGAACGGLLRPFIG